MRSDPRSKSLVPALKNASLTVPPGYKKRDFNDLLVRLSEHTAMRVNGGYIKMGIVSKHFLVEKMGRMFGVWFLAMLGHVSVDIQEVTDINMKEWEECNPTKINL